MKFTAQNVYHIFNQGNNKEIIYRDRDDYLTFLREIKSLISPNCEIISYCLMPDHFHLMIYVDDRIENLRRQGGILINPVVNGIRKLLSGYARIFNKKYGRTGSLFRQKTKAKLLSVENTLQGGLPDHSDYCFNCFHYIHQNPLKAGLVKKIEDWEFSSFRDYAGLRNGQLCNKELAVKFCSYNPRDFLKYSASDILQEPEW